MIIKSKLQLEIITSNSLANLKSKVNLFFETHEIKNVSYNYNGVECVAFIHYEAVEKTAESVRDSYELAGEVYRCQDCPKWGVNYRDEPGDAFLCMAKVTKKTLRGCTPACDFFYESIARGDFRPYE